MAKPLYSKVPTREIVAVARSWRGTPFVHGASCKGVGTDCLGLVRGVWRTLYGSEPPVPPYGADWMMHEEDQLNNAAERYLIASGYKTPKAGKILLFRWREHEPVGHMAIATTKGTMVHAHDGACVAEVPIHPTWLRRLVAICDFPKRPL